MISISVGLRVLWGVLTVIVSIKQVKIHSSHSLMLLNSSYISHMFLSLLPYFLQLPLRIHSLFGKSTIEHFYIFICSVLGLNRRVDLILQLICASSCGRVNVSLFEEIPFQPIPFCLDESSPPHTAVVTARLKQNEFISLSAVRSGWITAYSVEQARWPSNLLHILRKHDYEICLDHLPGIRMNAFGNVCVCVRMWFCRI